MEMREKNNSNAIAGIMGSAESFISKDSNLMLIGILLAIACAIPIWMLPFAPFPDWITHLAFFKEFFLIGTGQLVHKYYYLNLSFLGYSFTYILMFLLQNFFSLEISGKIALTLFVFSTPICWFYFFRVMAPERKAWFVAGFLLLFSWWYFLGLISFAFSINFGLLLIAAGWKADAKSRGDIARIVVFALLTYMAHAYTAALCMGILLVVYLYRICVQKVHLERTGLLPLMAIGILLAINSFGMAARRDMDLGYFKTVQKCVDAVDVDAMKVSTISPAVTVIAKWLIRFDVTEYFSRVFLYGATKFALLLALAGFLAGTFVKIFRDGKTADFDFFLKNENIDYRFLAIAFLFLAHYAVDIDYAAIQLPVAAGIRSVPFFFVFLLLSIKNRNFYAPLFCLFSVFVLLSAAQIAYTFAGYAHEQADILEKMKTIAQSIPDNSTVFAVPSGWNSIIDEKSTIFGQPHYHSVILVYNPTLYVSSQFLTTNSIPVSSKFGIYDEFWWVGDEKNPYKYASCYKSPPKEFDWIVDENMTLKKNA